MTTTTTTTALAAAVDNCSINDNDDKKRSGHRRYNLRRFGGKKKTTTTANDTAIATTTDVVVPSNNDNDDKSTSKSKSSPSSSVVRFGSVRVWEFERRLGETVVPSHGGWPLGMSQTANAEAEDSEGEEGGRSSLRFASCDEYERSIRQRRQQRQQAAASSSRRRRQQQHPFHLHGSLDEEQRKCILLESFDAARQDEKQRGRSLSSSSFAADADADRIRNEMEQVRESCKASNQGCNCGADKPRFTLRTSLATIEFELQKRQVALPSPPKKKQNGKLQRARNKKELLELLQAAIRNEPCCDNGDSATSRCPCAQQGLECHNDLCKCCDFCCRNPNGTFLFDVRRVREHWKAYKTAKKKKKNTKVVSK